MRRLLFSNDFKHSLYFPPFPTFYSNMTVLYFLFLRWLARHLELPATQALLCFFLPSTKSSSVAMFAISSFLAKRKHGCFVCFVLDRGGGVRGNAVFPGRIASSFLLPAKQDVLGALEPTPPCFPSALSWSSCSCLSAWRPAMQELSRGFCS